MNIYVYGYKVWINCWILYCFINKDVVPWNELFSKTSLNQIPISKAHVKFEYDFDYNVRKMNLNLIYDCCPPYSCNRYMIVINFLYYLIGKKRDRQSYCHIPYLN